MSRETLETDLRNQSHKKLLQWLSDTAELYRMADFDSATIFMTLLTCLIWELIRVAKVSGMPLKVVQQMITRASKAQKEQAK